MNAVSASIAADQSKSEVRMHFNKRCSGLFVEDIGILYAYKERLRGERERSRDEESPKRLPPLAPVHFVFEVLLPPYTTDTYSSAHEPPPLSLGTHTSTHESTYTSAHAVR